MTRSSEAWVKFLATRVVGLVVDSVVLAAAYWGAFALRFDFSTPRWGWRAVALSFVTVVVVQIAALLACGCYRIAWRRLSRRDLPRYFLAALVACFVLTVMRFFTPIDEFLHVRPPYSVTLITTLLAAFGLVGWRMVWSAYAASRVREDTLLERSVRRMDGTTAARFLSGKTVLVTGAGGSIGSEIVRQVVRAGPKLVLMVERGENALYEIDREMRQVGVTVPMKALMVDVNDRERMEDVLSFYRPEVILHAAAYKHVPMVEQNPREGERNNTGATKGLAELALKYRVARFVLISTDKAVNPVSVMGRTKLAAERAILALNADDAPTSFCAVRFGNVLGSSGSVVPLFREQIAHRRPVTVTHPDMKRYFMTVEEAVGLVLQAASRDEKAVYTLDMGKPVRILDLAEDMIRQAGYKPYVDIPIVFTGIRPGEKLFEELDISEKSAYKTDMARIYVTKADSAG
ncbi:MAG: SDR family NAD(P)-dependent oxidoreductase [Kiritimatiellae bacterium]|nr:SDR family NAD(P)-dependent oxidoreductase [Kiritimatiellia bacterium]